MKNQSDKTEEEKSLTTNKMGGTDSYKPELKRKEGSNNQAIKTSRTYAHADPEELLALAKEKMHRRQSCEHYKAERRGSNPFVDPKSLANARIKMKTRERRHRQSEGSSSVDGVQSSSARRTRDLDRASSHRRPKSRDSLDGMGSSHHKPRGGTRSSKCARGLDDHLEKPSRRSKKGSSHSVTSRTSRIRDDTKLRASNPERRSTNERKHKHRHYGDEDSEEKAKQNRSMSPKRSSGMKQSLVHNSLDDSQDLSLSPKRKAGSKQSSMHSCASDSPKHTSSSLRHSSRRSHVDVDADEISRQEIEKQQRVAMEGMRARVPKRLSLENDDMFTMFRWSTDSLQDELKVDYERGEFAKAREQETKKRLEPLTVQSVFSEKDLELIPTKAKKPTRPSLLRRLSKSVNHKATDTTGRRGSLFGRLLRRASTTFGGFGASFSDRDTSTLVGDSEVS
jgi:hypothetical protein